MSLRQSISQPVIEISVVFEQHVSVARLRADHLAVDIACRDHLGGIRRRGLERKGDVMPVPVKDIHISRIGDVFRSVNA